MKIAIIGISLMVLAQSELDNMSAFDKVILFLGYGMAVIGAFTVEAK